MADETQQLVTLAEFLKRNPVLSESTVRRWIRSGRLAHCQPGGKRTKLLIPIDALTRMEVSAQEESIEQAPSRPIRERISGPSPDWLD